MQGRATSYWLNARADAELAQVIIIYLKDPTVSPPPNKRFDQIVDLASASTHPQFFLAACAYTLWEINGRMDYQVARIYAWLSGFTRHLPVYHFAQPSPTPIPLISSWLLPVMRSQSGLQRFLIKHHLSIQGSTDVFIKAIVAIQHLNIAHNLETIDTVGTSASNKAQQLQKYSKLSSNPQTFLHAATQTQRAAIFWDKLFIKLLRP